MLDRSSRSQRKMSIELSIMHVFQMSLVFVSLSLLMSSDVARSSVVSRKEQEEYLRRYAYMGPSSPDPRLASLTNPEEVFRNAVMKFQMMAGLNATGRVDEKTKDMMEMPRCGVPDEVGMGMITRKRRRRYAAQGSKWPKTDLTYRINNYTPDLSPQTTASEIRTAFKHWSDASPLTFTEVNSRNAKVDIDINFAKRDHGDGAPFDGPGKTLAHAFFPQFEGDAHFDEDEEWTSGSYRGTNLLQVAIHEFGHSLGLSHSDVQESIMAPFYRRYNPNVKLHSDDIAGINYIYGRPFARRTTTPPSPRRLTSSAVGRQSVTTRPQPPTQLCKDPKVDAMFAVNDDIYLFKGSEYYKLDLRGVLPGYPRPISEDWQGLPNDIDTAFYSPDYVGSIYFFKGDKYWRYNTQRQPLGLFPQSISSKFYKVPSDLDAAFIWSGNGKLYFIKGENYYRLSTPYVIVDAGYPLKLKYWKGLPEKIDSAFNFGDIRTYFFSGESYYRFNDVKFQVDVGYPRRTATWWLGCDYSYTINEKTQSKDSGNSAMTDELAKGRDQFMTGGVQSQTTAIWLSTAISIFVLLMSLF